MNETRDYIAQPFYNIEAEAAMLGAAMIDNRCVQNVVHIIAKEDFYEPLHGRIWSAIVKFVERDKVATPVTLRPIFESDAAMAQVGGPAYLAQLTGSGAALIGHVTFAEQIRDLARIREVSDAVAKGLEDVNQDATLEAFLSRIEIATSKAAIDMRPTPVMTLENMVQATEDRANRSLEHGVPGASCKTIRDIDTLIGRLEGGQMTILAGRPGMGKTTTSMSASLGYAMNGEPGLYCLAESSAEMFSLKMTSDLLHAAGCPVLFKTLKEGILSKADSADVARAHEIAKSLPLTLAHIGRSDVRQVEAQVAREVIRLKRLGKKLAYVVVDYLQLLTADGRHRVGDDRGRVNVVSETLLKIAQRYDTHVIALSQLSRAVEAREDKRPRLADLRESGRLEEDADNVVFVYREEYYLEKMSKPTDEKQLVDHEILLAASRAKIEIIAAKTRFGSNATRKCNFYGDYSAVRGSAYVNPQDGVGDLFGGDDDAI